MATKLKINWKNVTAIKKGPRVTALIAQRVKRGAREAGDGFEGLIQPHPKSQSARGVIRTADKTGRKRQADEQAILRGLDGMR